MRAALLVLLPMLAAGCANEGALVARLRSCGLLSEGETGWVSLGPIYAPDACYQDCLAEAPCEDLEAALCRSNLGLLTQCDQRCAFRCGDGPLIGLERRCDGIAQCADGSDEAGCPGWERIVCDDGSTVMGARCDEIYTCADASDERDCPRMSCDGGALIISPWDRCNGYRYCLDGADEAGCPRFGCDDGTEITHRAGESPRCNGWYQCSDGSDEDDCAMLTLDCS